MLARTPTVIRNKQWRRVKAKRAQVVRLEGVSGSLAMKLEEVSMALLHYYHCCCS